MSTVLHLDEKSQASVDAENMLKFLHDKGYKAGYEAGYKDGEKNNSYEAGIRDAFDAVRGIMFGEKDGGLPVAVIAEAFGECSWQQILKEENPAIVTRKIKNLRENNV